MAAETLRLKPDRTDRIRFSDSGVLVNTRVRPHETITIDLSVSEQAAAIDADNYESDGGPAVHHPFTRPEIIPDDP